MPLAVGNSWTYEWENGDIHELNIISRANINGVAWCITNGDDYFRNESDGLWKFDTDDGIEYLVVKYPIDVNE